MKLFFKNLYIFILVVLMASSLSCNKEEKFLSKENQLQQNHISKKPTEEEIKYFFPGGEYDIYITKLHFNYYDSNKYLRPESIEKNMNVVDKKGNVVNLLSLLELVKIGEDEEDVKIYPKGSMVNFIEVFSLIENDANGEYLFKADLNIEEYRVIKESYGPGRSYKRYCKTADPDFVSKDYIFDDKLLIRLYDNNNNIILENQMRRNVKFDNFDPDFSPKIKAYGKTDVWLVGTLELPSKEQRKGLKYRVLRVDEKGNPKPFLWNLGKPYNYYHLEKPLEPYSEYSTWSYIEDLGCYHKATYRRSCPPPFLCSQ